MYLNTDTSAYPISEQEIRAAHPNTSFPQPFTPPEGYAWVFPAPQPTYDPITHSVREIAPELTDKGHWEQRWEVVALPAEAVAANQAAKAEQIKASIVQATQARLDDFARERGYDDIKSASGYVGCSVARFAAEGAYCRDARAETWDALYTMLAEVEAGTRLIPTGYSDIEPELPVLEWPAQ